MTQLWSRVRLFMFVASISITTSGSEIVLIPIGGTSQPIDGAFGSKWVVLEYARNTGKTAVDYILPNCPTAFCGFTFQPGETIPNQLYPFGVYWLSGGNTDQVHFSITVRDDSRENESWGAQIPAVRERDLHSDEVELIRIPTDSRYRRNLRVYAVWPAGNGDTDTTTIRVRIFDADADLSLKSVPLGERELVLDARSGAAPRYAGAASIANLDEVFAGASTGAVRVVLERMSGIGQIWGFVTLTNNVTQHFTTFTP